MIAHSLRKIHILGNREKTVQRLIYQGVNYFYGSKIMGSYLKKKSIFFWRPSVKNITFNILRI